MKKIHQYKIVSLVIFVLIFSLLLFGCPSSKDEEIAEKPIAIEIKEIQAIDLPVEVETITNEYYNATILQHINTTTLQHKNTITQNTKR